MKKRNFVQSLLLVAFLFVGLQQATAQKGVTFLSPTQALQTLETEVTNLKEAKANQPASPALENPVSGMKILYYTGIATRLNEGMSTANAVISNHSSFMALAPQVGQAANTLRDHAVALLEL